MLAVTWMLVTSGAAIWMGWKVWRQLLCGRATVPWSIPRWPVILRTEQPVRFLATIAGETLCILLVAFFALVLTLAVFHAV